MPTTFDCLLAHFAGKPFISIETVAQLLELDADTLVEKINQRKIDLTYFRAVDGQKGRKFVMISDLAEHIDACCNRAKEDFAKFG